MQIGEELIRFIMTIMNELQKKSLYGSHMPVLAKIMDLSDGPVLELGMGIYSTPLLDMMCKEQKRELISYDNDPKWFKENEKWTSDYHKVYFVEDWDEIEVELVTSHWGVAFIDHKPAKRRKVEMKLLAQHANYVIVHDTEPESDKFFKYTWMHKYYKYQWNYTKARPHTSVFSNFIDLQGLDRK